MKQILGIQLLSSNLDFDLDILQDIQVTHSSVHCIHILILISVIVCMENPLPTDNNNLLISILCFCAATDQSSGQLARSVGACCSTCGAVQSLDSSLQLSQSLVCSSLSSVSSLQSPYEVGVLVQDISSSGIEVAGDISLNLNAVLHFRSLEGLISVTLIFEKELGMFIVPFYGTLCHILESDNYKDIQGWDECLKAFIENDKISATLVKRLVDKYPKFIDKLNDLYEKEMTLNEYLEEYKVDYLKNKIYSPTSVLYSSKAFGDLMGFIPSEAEIKAKEIQSSQSTIGRNEPCPCGSGKKYKKCCGAMV